MTRKIPTWTVVRDGEKWGVEDADGILENEEPLSHAAATTFAINLQRAWGDARANEAYWSRESFGA